MAQPGFLPELRRRLICYFASKRFPGEAAPTAAILSNVFGFKNIARDGTLIRCRANDAPFAYIIDIREAIDFPVVKMPLVAAIYRKNTQFKLSNRPYFRTYIG